jgi:hypothetical protein
MGREAPERDIDRYLQALWLRAAFIYGARALVAAIGTFALVLIILGLSSGPVVTALWSRAALVFSLGCAFGIGAWALWPLKRVSRGRRQRLLAHRDPALASRVRSALELTALPAAGQASPALVAAHAGAVRAAVVELPAGEIVPWRWLRHESLVSGLLACALALGAFQLSERAQSGVAALLAPATLGSSGVRIASVLDGVDGRLVFPSYLERAPEVVREVSDLSIPRGTTVELTLRPRVATRSGAIAIGDEVVRLVPGKGGLVGRFVARKSGPLALRVLHEDAWYEDSKPRALNVQDDRAPEVRLTAGPIDGAVVQLDDVVGLGFEARDDHGLAAIELALRLPSGEETRERLWSSIGVQGPTGQVVAQAEIAVARLDVAPGDIVLAWIEARDADVVSGPHISASRTVTLEVATDAQEISLQIPALRQVLDTALDVLAARLERPLPSAAHLAAQRHGELRELTDAWLVLLDQLIDAAGRAQTTGLDADQLRGIASRTRRELTREAAAHDGGGNEKRSADADSRVVAEQERDVLLLADMLAAALVDEARALTSELNAMKEHMRELLEQLKKAPSEEAKRELLAELAKAQRRLRDLAQSLSRLAQNVPSEFINREAIPQGGAQDAMAALQAAIESGDMVAAEKQLEELAQQIDSLASHVDQGGARFREARFGEHDRAVAQARNKLGMLAAEQERLAGRSREIVQDAARKAQARAGASGADPAAMQQLAQGAQTDLDSLGQSDPSGSDGQMLSQARERARDVSDALKTGDLAEARRMGAAAQRSLDALARSLDRDAQMFPGHHGEARERAEAAAEAAGKLRRLQEQLDRAMPPLDGFMGEGERERLRSDLPPQRSARETADQLGGQMGAESEGAPVSPDAQRGLSEVTDAMRRAEQALQQGDAEQASRAQDEAADKLRQIEQGLAQKGQGKPSPKRGERGQEGEREGNGNGVNAEGPVRIPGADDFKSPVEMRRRVLDAMREEGPSGFESAQQRYYEGLLR